MKTPILKIFFFLLCFFCLVGQKGYGQTAPNITYSSPQSLTINVALPSPISPTNNGGAVPAQTYGAVTSLATGLTNPGNIVTDPAGNLYVCEVNGYRIKKITPAGVVTNFAGSGVNGTVVNAVGTGARFSRVDGITIDAAGLNLYVSDYDNKVIRKIVISSATVSTFATTGTALVGPAGLDFDNLGNLYVADQGNHTIKRITTGGVVSVIAGTGAIGQTNSTTGTSASFNGPSDVDYDGSGNLIVTDQSNNRLRKIILTAPFAVTTVAGSSAGYTNAATTTAQFSAPVGSTLDGAGNFYVADFTNNDIRRVTAAGVVSLFAGSASQAPGTTNANLTTSTFNGPYDVSFDANTSFMFVADYTGGNIRKLTLSGYTISPALPAGLTFNATTGVITGTPTALSAATDYTITAYNYYGSSITTLNLAVVNVLTTTDANTSGNGITQGTLRPGQTDIVLFGFGLNANSSMTISGFKINTATGTNGPGFYFTSGRLYKNTTANTFAGAQLVSSSISFTYNANTNPGITVSGISEFFTQSNTPTYYFIVADIPNNFNTLNAASQTMQFKLETTQTDAYSSTNTSANAPKTNIPGTVFTIAPPVFTVTDNNITANGVTNGSLSYGQTDVVFFSFKLAIDGALHVVQFDIPSNIDITNYFTTSSFKLYRSTTANFATAQLVTATFSYNSSKLVVTGIDESLNSYTGNNNYYYFLSGDFTNTNSGTNTFNFALTSGVVAFTQNTPYSYKQVTSPATITGKSYTVNQTYVWVGTTDNNFNTPTNYRTLNNSGVGGVAPSATTAIYIPTVFQGNTIIVSPVVNTAPTSIASLTFGGTSPPALLLNGRTLNISGKLVVSPGTTANITGTGTGTNNIINLTAAAVTSGIEAGSILNLTGAAILNNAGTFTMESTSALNLTGNSKTSNTSTFLLKSDANGSATIGPLSGTSTFTGDYQVERYFTGGSANSRGYRLMSSPVSVSSASLILPNLTYISANAYTTGTGGSTNGFDVAGNPTLYFYRENLVPNSSSFLTSNFRGVKTINNTSTFTMDNDAGNFNLPAGNGFLFFFRGNRASNATVNTAAIAQTATFTNTGYLNQGSITVRHWTMASGTGLLNTSAGSASVKGFNLVGNPYASSINWDGSGITATNLETTIWVYNPTLKVYATYVKGNSGNGTNFNGPAANIIPSGQGFFVRANNTNPSITFTEAAKVTNQVTSTTLLMSTGTVDVVEPLKLLRVRIYKDSLNREDALIFLKNDSKEVFVRDEDAEYLRGNNVVTMSTISADKKNLAINSIPLPKKTATILPLNANITTTGLYQISLTEAKNIPALYEVYLKDALKKDSLDVLTHSTYNFNATAGDSTTFGTKRFSLVIRQKAGMALRLLDFAAAKVTLGAELSWITENESNYTNFTVERSTDGGKTYEVIGGLQSTALGKYTLVDKGPVIGQNMYRLKQDDINGTISYSKVVTLMYSTKAAEITVNNITVYPNPASSFINVGIVPQSNATSYNIRITNGVGLVVRSATTSQTTWQDNVSNLLPGTYFVQVTVNNTKALVGNGRFIKN